jgi:branched-chain amino acid transport system permease protein
MSVALALVAGITQGAMIALVALGYTMVYGILRLINFAHSEVFMMSAYLGLVFLTLIASESALDLHPLGMLAAATVFAMLGAASMPSG